MHNGLFFSSVLFWLLANHNPKRQEAMQVRGILHSVLKAKRAIEEYGQEHPKAGIDNSLFVTFWDFDGTILAGDCTEGYTSNGKQIYKGLAEICIEQGLSPQYPTVGGFRKFWHDYEQLLNSPDPQQAYALPARIFKGTDAATVKKLARDHFETTLRHYYFQSSSHVIATLQRNGIATCVVSASPTIFVQGAASTTGIEESCFFGVDTQIENGKLSDRITGPVSAGAGKVERIQQVMQRLQTVYGNRPLFVLAGFGNSYRTDGHFLSWIAAQQMPAGKPVAVMINGGSPPPDYANRFTTVGYATLARP